MRWGRSVEDTAGEGYGEGTEGFGEGIVGVGGMAVRSLGDFAGTVVS